jgi:hypothetical protein
VTHAPPRIRRARGAVTVLLTILLSYVMSGATARAGGAVVAPYVPTMPEDVERMLAIAGVGRGDYVIDLGSGDGRIVIAAAARGAIAHGVEISEALVATSRRNAAEAGVADRALFVHDDIFAADIGCATVVTMFLMPDANLALRPKLLAELRPGTRVVSNSFDMGDWRPDRHIEARTSGGILMWVIPADVAGRWDVAVGGGETLELVIEQRYQEISAEFRAPSGESMVIEEALLDGERITLVARADGRHLAFNGTVADRAMTGYVHDRTGDTERLMRWSAERRTP